ncbi:hypothetical protein [Streptomyces sp. NBC_00078]|uniref:hypothetical protein n=1 Tax=unclassified Streptomyces TaxID=2593676 RepID=UPI0022545981|nr:hypothetical protein [Streptomyces sp. NBC_00078]MCX5423327.1 hypothetical protein [Streptomyces sp. NBC_00078]
MSIIHALLHRALALLAPGTGTRRATARPAAPAPAVKAPCPQAVTLPAHRSPYGLPVPLDGRATALVRPYVLAAEREREQECARRRRRIALVLAADFGIDLDRHVVGAERAA